MDNRVENICLSLTLMLCLWFAGSFSSYAAGAKCPPKNAQVKRAMFTTRVADREPVNQVLILEDKVKLIYFYTDLRNLQGHEVIHRWEHDGKVVSQKTFEVKGPRWRVFSSMHLNSSMLGRWTVVVTTKDGCPLKASVFQYVATDPKGQGSAILKIK